MTSGKTKTRRRHDAQLKGQILAECEAPDEVQKQDGGQLTTLALADNSQYLPKPII
jgi:hypothetical protein